ncbi:autophagy-related protein 27 [Ceratobasidium sp. AG-Ba]|nr:autophagy-related protein 27 [Ceratobasidium sp. AG-Ba]
MIVPWRRHTLLLLLYAASTLANSGPFDCKADLSGVHYDFTLLGNDERTVERDRSSPPSTMHDVLRFNICKDLGRQDGVKDVDQCSQGTRACFTTTNKKPEEQDRIVSVVPLAQSADDYTIQPFSSDSGKGVTLVLNGGSYPSDGPKQSLKVVMFCAPQTQAPKLTEYNGSQATIEWRVFEACGSQGNNDPPKSGGGSSPPEDDVGGSSMGWFFFILLVVIAAYFGFGAYHNYNQYGASGWDLIPYVLVL